MQNIPPAKDLWIFSIGGNVNYIFNAEKLSYKAAYLRTQIQKRSAGSFTSCIFFYKDKVGSEQGFIPPELPRSLQDAVDLKEFDAITVGVSAGYTYTFVVRGNFFLNLSMFPGLGYRYFDLKTLNEQDRIIHTVGIQLIVSSAICYEFKHLYLGATFAMTMRNFSYNISELNLGTGQVRLTVGKRFDVCREK